AFSKINYLKRLAAKLKFPFVMQWLQEFLEDTDEKVVVAAIHKAAIHTLKKKFPDSTVIDGSVPSKKRQLAVTKFQTDPKVRMMIMNIQAGGVGIDLTAASTGVVAELDWIPGSMLQLEDR